MCVVALCGRTDGAPVIHMHEGAGESVTLTPRRGAVTPSTGWGEDLGAVRVLSPKVVSGVVHVKE